MSATADFADSAPFGDFVTARWHELHAVALPSFIALSPTPRPPSWSPPTGACATPPPSRTA